jgi:hypothetical protein
MKKITLNWSAGLNGLADFGIDDNVFQAVGFGATGSSAMMTPADLSAFAPGLYMSIFDYGEGGGGVAYSNLLNSIYFLINLEDVTQSVQAQFSFFQTKWNEATMMRDTLTSIESVYGAPTNGAWGQLGLPMKKAAAFEFGMEPDSLFLGFMFLAQDSNAVGNSKLYIDEIMLVNDIASGVKENTAANTNVNVYPTVSSTVVNFEFEENSAKTVTLLNIEGKAVKTIEATTTAVVNVSDLAAGVYVYQVVNNAGQFVNSGKFIVE